MTRVLITGGAAGLGASLAAAYRARGADVVVADIAETAETADGLHLDVRSEGDWAAARAWVEEHWGGLDVLVNNAGVAGGGRVDVATMEEWQWITEINLFGVVRGTRTFVPMMKQAGSGTILNIASLAGLVHPAGMGSYNAVKAGVVAFTETIGHELAAFGIRAAAVCPSYFRTGLMDSVQGADTALSATMTKLVANAPLGPDDIAAAVLEGLDRGEELILPDPAARAAYELKLSDRAAYDAQLRRQAERLS
ncbi:SDR family NAD(P)-dependent oxidoreductase [Nocardioides mangrovicus]|uniref:SDR family NAD(P)-dependent oxidoreductase n=1 Tax=Nocardioides mangrovicus TaxID=2478913 RepID=A0A3L8NZB3_9ACTN|nr:SDR family NAD(P)-dependent oxidoreductase [Nocardioides mangrovicus]RLV48002.1 SDR family NAD(P)-dependent oxidoreductase [Nocardioides mangrovicus]